MNAIKTISVALVAGFALLATSKCEAGGGNRHWDYAYVVYVKPTCHSPWYAYKAFPTLCAAEEAADYYRFNTDWYKVRIKKVIIGHGGLHAHVGHFGHNNFQWNGGVKFGCHKTGNIKFKFGGGKCGKGGCRK